MQHDHARRITVLLDSPNRYAFTFRALPHACQQFEAFFRVP